MSKTELSVMGGQLRAQSCTADEAIGLSGIVLYGRWVNPSQRPGVNYGDSLCALKTFRDLDKAPSAKTFFTLSKAKDRDALTQFWAHGHQLLVDGGRNQCASTTQSAYGERGASSCQRRITRRRVCALARLEIGAPSATRIALL